MGSSPSPPPVPPVQDIALPPPPMQESPYAKGSYTRKQNAAMAQRMSMHGTLINGGQGLAGAADTTGKALLGV